MADHQADCPVCAVQRRRPSVFDEKQRDLLRRQMERTVIEVCPICQTDEYPIPPGRNICEACIAGGK